MQHYNLNDWKLMSQRQRMSPFPNYMSMEAMTSSLLQKYTGARLTDLILIFEDRVMNGFNRTTTFDRAGQELLSRIQKEPTLYARLIKKQDRLGKILVAYAKKAGMHARRAVSHRALLALWEGYEKRYKEVYACYGSVWVIEDVLHRFLGTIVQKRVPDIVQASTILDILTRQPSAMVARIEREALYKLAATITDKAHFTHDPRVLQRIRQHERDYFWVTRDYEDPVLTVDRIIERLRTYCAEHPKKMYRAMVAEQSRFEQERRHWTKALRLTRHEQASFRTMLDVMHLKELRKRYVSESLYHFDAVLLAIAHHALLSLKQVRFLSTNDVRAMLVRQKDVTEAVNARMTLSGWMTHNGKTTIVTGNDAATLKKIFLTTPKNAKTFYGNPVSPGIARGPVKIVMNPDEIHKVKNGDIIVSVQVVPSFAPALLRAAGLICDGGHGITTHPAVLAREAGIPAIIQTRFARKILKDGDIVEVDGYKGIARKLS